jgi:hypothetical protein
MEDIYPADASLSLSAPQNAEARQMSRASVEIITA